MRSIHLLGLIYALGACREITFPPIHPAGIPSSTHPGWEDDLGLRFHGLTTFAHLPYVECFKEDPYGTHYDIAILGAQFDTGVTARPGARYGPAGIRLGSRRMWATKMYDVSTGKNPFLSWATVVDCGDPLLTYLDNTIALKQLEEAHKRVSARKAKSTFQSTVPRIVTLGGDHTTTLAALRSTHSRWGKVSVIHFDSHIDTWDPKVLGGGISHYAGVNHGTFLHIAHEEGLIYNRSIHAGIRAPLTRPKADLRNDRRCGFDIVHARDIDRIGVAGIISALKERIGDNRVYVSVDIDVLDPAFAPALIRAMNMEWPTIAACITSTNASAATGTSEVGGWSTRELLSILEGLEGLQIIGGDVVEVAPAYDNIGEPTTLAAAEIAKTLIQLMVDTPVDAQSMSYEQKEL